MADFMTKLSEAVQEERRLHTELLAVRRKHAEAKRNKEALVNWLADGMPKGGT